ncbi:MAG: hypothetical protein IPG63_17015 [Xanthomonadales bacterium]|nr:hypothetical protein [Xanthomonadales bacterium]MBK7146085.1 hypothetical protein [Xanthomonadales bacterium]
MKPQRLFAPMVALMLAACTDASAPSASTAERKPQRAGEPVPVADTAASVTMPAYCSPLGEEEH